MKKVGGILIDLFSCLKLMHVSHGVLSEIYTSPALFRGVVILVVLSKRRLKKRSSLTEYVRAARKWWRKLCKLAAVLQLQF